MNAQGYIQVDPSSPNGAYWVAVAGQTFACWPIEPEHAIITVYHRVAEVFPDAGPYQYGCAYVIRQPKQHTRAAWKRWSWKWACLTARAQENYEAMREDDARLANVGGLDS